MGYVNKSFSERIDLYQGYIQQVGYTTSNKLFKKETNVRVAEQFKDTSWLIFRMIINFAIKIVIKTFS